MTMREQAANMNSGLWVPAGAADVVAPNKYAPQEYRQMTNRSAPGRDNEIGGTIEDQLTEVNRLLKTHNGNGFFSPSAIYTIRKAAANSPYVRGFLKLAKSQVVGRTGINPTFDSVVSKGQREVLRALWDEFASDPTVMGDRDLVDALEGTQSSLLTDGMVFWTVRYSSEYPHQLAIHPIPRELFMDYADGAEKNTARGIRYSEAGRVLSYRFASNFRDLAEQNRFTGTTIFGNVPNQAYASGRASVEIPVGRMLVVHRPDRHASHNLDSSTILPLLQMDARNRLIDQAAFEAVNASSAITAFIQRDQTASGDAKTDAVLKDAMSPDSMKGGMVILPRGHSVVSHTPVFPNVNVNLMQEKHLRAGSASVGVDYPTFANDPGDANFGSLRAFAVMTRDGWERDQDVLTKKMMKPLLKMWISTGMLPGGVLARNGVSRKAATEAMRSEFAVKQHDWFEPAKEAQALALLSQLGVISPQEIMRKRGRDPQAVVNDWVEFGSMLKKAGELKGENEGALVAARAFITAMSGGQDPTDNEPSGAGDNNRQ